MLFYGPPGTGKSALARYLSEKLDRELVVKRASDILSPWVGMSERQVAEAFRAAENAVLLIDEVDGFLYSREIATRSWESTLVNEFLTALEECKGFCICTTNRMENMDPAAMRRFSFKVRFDYAGPEQVDALYGSLLAPLAPGRLPARLRERLLGLTRLAPGDFNAVRSKYWLSEPGEVTHERLVRDLADEQSLKLERLNRRVGF
jgi:DNA polymerase III delta prime subunit